jgi:protoporphyrinogen oxidase
MNTVIVGACLAGLAAAHELNKGREKFLLLVSEFTF